MQVNPNGQVIANASLIDRTLKGAPRRAFFCQEEWELSYGNLPFDGRQHVGTYEDMVDVSPHLAKVICAFGLSQLPFTLGHK